VRRGEGLDRRGRPPYCHFPRSGKPAPSGRPEPLPDHRRRWAARPRTPGRRAVAPRWGRLARPRVKHPRDRNTEPISCLPTARISARMTTGPTGKNTQIAPPKTPPLPVPSIPHPGNIPPGQAPGPGWVWKGQLPEGGGQGNWFNQNTGESLWNDMNSPTHGPHWDYRIKGEPGKWRWYPDGRMEYAPP
jgi:hypothetical protein